ncbi:TetR/AcrR family transcriptional regulator [Microbacterium pygmaeum]|uniref:DNA-binding transcriptional regulator, AcrR family n=1 Tax=Microbacterium pygmaeum TaxID=370764 RepID=A0A1G7WGE4_9MICO|nr:TetR/AcrR family transcriptional regulator [Microbacterium pygmaeum]SDG70270.1 DNA-binding transcriptional regulator, AcrR family [Microbacterium pygmaeum]
MTTGRRGARRSETARVAILAATVRLFATRGYDHLSIEGIAAEAGVAKQTIYRWWPSKGPLIAECMLEGMLLPGRFVPRDTGDVRADLAAWLDAIFGFLIDPTGESIFRSLISAAAENVEVGVRLRDSLGAASSLVERLGRGVEAGQIPPDAPLQEVSEALVGAVIVRALSRTPLAPGDPERLVDAVIGVHR